MTILIQIFNQLTFKPQIFIIINISSATHIKFIDLMHQYIKVNYHMTGSKPANVVPVFKKGSRVQPSNYQPQVVCETLECISSHTLITILFCVITQQKQHAIAGSALMQNNIRHYINSMLSRISEIIQFGYPLINAVGHFMDSLDTKHTRASI